MYIALIGNISEGYVAYGPYATFGEASDKHTFEMGWIMQVKNVDDDENDN